MIMNYTNIDHLLIRVFNSFITFYFYFFYVTQLSNQSMFYIFRKKKKKRESMWVLPLLVPSCTHFPYNFDIQKCQLVEL